MNNASNTFSKIYNFIAIKRNIFNGECREERRLKASSARFYLPILLENVRVRQPFHSYESTVATEPSPTELHAADPRDSDFVRRQSDVLHMEIGRASAHSVCANPDVAPHE